MINYSSDLVEPPFDFSTTPDKLAEALTRLTADPTDGACRIELGRLLGHRSDLIRWDGRDIWLWYTRVLEVLYADPIWATRPKPVPGRRREKVPVRLCGRVAVWLTGGTADEYGRTFAAATLVEFPSIIVHVPLPSLLVVEIAGRGDGRRGVWDTIRVLSADGGFRCVLSGVTL